MSARLQDEVESTIDQLVMLALEDTYLTALAAEQWMADLNEADSLEQVGLSHRCLLGELQRIAARDLARRLDVAARWFGAAGAGNADAPSSTAWSRPLGGNADATVPTLPGADAALPIASWVAMVSGAALDSANLKGLRHVLYDTPPQRMAGAESPEESGAESRTAAAGDAASGPVRMPRRADHDTARDHLRAG